MSALTQAARGMPCMIRLAGCLSSTETVVGCHYRLAGFCGTGMKSPDWMLAWGCAHCHACTDGRQKTEYSYEQLRLYHAEGVMRTWAALIERGKITIGKRGIAE